MQKAIRKKLSVKRVPPAFELTHQAGITSCIMLMVGNQGETRDTMRESVGLASELQPDRILINTTKVYPGTYLWDAAVEEGVIPDDYFESDAEKNPFDLAPDYTGENPEPELRRLERMLQHRTTYVAVADGCTHSVDECASCEPRKLRSLERLEQQFLMTAWRGEQSVLGGGEPLAHPDLFELLEFGKVRGVHHLGLYSSARLLTRAARQKLSASGMIERLIVPIFAIHDPHHDGRVKSSGALRETRKGILGWTRGSGKASVWGFIDRWNVSSLRRWPAWLKEHGVDRVVFVFGESPSDGIEFRSRIYPRSSRQVASSVAPPKRPSASKSKWRFPVFPNASSAWTTRHPNPTSSGGRSTRSSMPTEHPLPGLASAAAPSLLHELARVAASGFPAKGFGPRTSSATAKVKSAPAEKNGVASP